MTTIADHLRCVREGRRFAANTQEAALVASVLGAAGELGEVIEPIKKAVYHGRTLDVQHVLDEIGDVLWYLHSLIDLLGGSLDGVLAANRAKLDIRAAAAAALRPPPPAAFDAAPLPASETTARTPGGGQ